MIHITTFDIEHHRKLFDKVLMSKAKPKELKKTKQSNINLNQTRLWG